ncbi:MAG: hypothetical protein PHW50_01995, partial [Patescibacteria group bacterium]|nr:hypothetical protein [Patescibacteria group bacterium]
IEEQLKLPSGSLQGSNWNEIFTNTYKSYLSQTLGLQGIEINDFNSSQELGQALIKKSFYTQTDENQIFNTVTRSNVFYQNLWQLNPGEMTLALQKKDLNYLASLIGNKFKDGFMNQENPQYQTNWLGLPKGDLSDPKYKIAAGRYILAMVLNLEDQEKTFTSNDYFFKNAPYSPSVGFDICPGIAGEQTCPTYEIFNDPNNFFQKVGEALIVKKDTDLDFGSDFGSIFKKSLGINKISLTNLAKILSNGSEKEKLNQAISVLIQETLKDNLEISNQLPGIFSENRIKNGDWAFILNLLGLNKVSREAVLPPNTLEKLSLPNIDVEDVAQEIASYQILESLGVNTWSLDKSTFPDDWYKNPQELTTIAIVAWLNNRGIEIGNLDLNGKLEINLTDFNSLMGIAAGDTEQGTVPENIAALLGLSTEELKMILDNLKNNKNSDTVRQLLSETADQKLGLPPNSTYQLLKGELNINDWLESAWMENTLFALTDQKAAQALNLPEESKIDLNQLINSIRSKDGNELENFLINVAQAKLGDIFKIPPTIILNFFNSDGDYQSQINDLKTLAIEKFAQNIVNNESQYNLLISAYENYLAGGSGDINNLFGDDVNINELISSSLNIPNNDASYFTQNNLSIAFSVLGAAKIANQAQSILGEQGISYEEVKKSFLGDLTIAKPTGREAISIYQTEQEKIKQTALKETAFNLADAALFSQDPDIPVGITKIMTEGTTDQKNRLLVDYIANKAGINPIIINDLVLKQDFDLQNLDVENFILGLPGIQKNTQQFNQIYNAFLDLKNFAKTENFESFSDATTSFLEEKTGIPINTLEQWQVALNNPSQLSNQLFIADQIGLTDAIDNAVGMNGFSGFVVNASRCYGSGGSDLGACASAVLQVFSWLGFGKVSCEDPQVVAQKQIRTTLTQVLDTDPTPTKIITFKKEDVYYFAGLNENGEFSQELNDLLTQKYGSVDERGDKGMFTSPTMWDHVHIGY